MVNDFVVLEVECMHARVAWGEKLRPKRKEENVNDENEWKCNVVV